jgi:protein SCO1/2
VLVVLIGGLLIVRNLWNGHAAAVTPSATFTAGTALGTSPAPAFTLTDQNGASISLAALKGHPVVLTFLDATCTTECPITAQYLDWTAQYLGKPASSVTWLAITVNPTNTPADVATFMSKNKVQVPLHVLLGTQAQLAPLWKAYYLEVIPAATPGGDVTHTIATYLIDSQGRERELLDQAYDPKAAAHDLSLLLAGR